VEVSTGEDEAPKTHTLAGKHKVLAGDDAEGEGVSSAEPIAPIPIRSDAPEQADHYVTDQVTLVVPPTGGRGCKRPLPIVRRKQPLPSTDQVITQIELPPYRGPQIPPNLVAVEIMLGHLFEVFRHASQVAGIGTSAGDDTRPWKKTCQPLFKIILAPR
jgi:hypothetical protein